MSAMLDGESILVGELEVRPHERAVLVRGRDVTLTPGEFGIVMMLAEHPGWVYSADQLSQGMDVEECSPESVSVLVSRLRQRLSAAGLSGAVETVRGFGYRLRTDERSRSTTGHELRDAAWQLQEAVIEVVHTGTPEQQCAAADALDRARHDVYSVLAE